MPDYIVSWLQGRERVVAATPEEAAAEAVARQEYDPEEVHGVEVAVYEKVLTRHDVIVNTEVFEDA